MRRGGLGLVVTALVLDTVALGLLGVAVWQTLSTGFFATLLVGIAATPVALAAAVVSGFAIVLRTSKHRRIATVGVVALSLGALPIGLLVLAAASTLTVDVSDNPARDAVHALAVPIESAGGHLVCRAGDPGFGPDNIQPWYVGVWEAPAGDALRDRAIDRASALGLQVAGSTPDPTRITVSFPTGTDGLAEVCGGTPPAAGDGRQLIRIDASAPPRS